MLGAVVAGAVVALALGGGSGGGGGAASPEAAVRQLATAVERQDPLGVAAALPPSEVRTLRSLLETTQDRLDEMGIADAGDPLPGVTIEIDALDVEVDELGPDAARVDLVAGTFSIEVDGATSATPIGSLLGGTGDPGRDDHRGSFDVDDAADAINAIFDSGGRRTLDSPFVVAVRRGGGWYVSPMHTLALHVVEGLRLSSPDYGAEPAEPLGDTPEAVFEELAAAVDRVRVRDVVAAFSTTELDVLTVYQDAIEDLVAEARLSPGELRVDLDDVRLTVGDTVGGSTRVVLDRARLVVADEWEQVDIELDGFCATVTSDYDGRSGGCLDRGLQRRLGLDEVFVMMSQDRGGWRIDPVATLLAYAETVLDTVSDADVYRALDLQHLAPPVAEIALGEEVSVTTDTAGSATFTLDLPEGLVEVRLLDTSGDGLEARLVDGENRSVARLGAPWQGSCGWRCVYEVDQPGPHRLVVTDWEWDEADIEVRVVEVPVHDLGGLPASLEISADAPGVQAYAFESDGSGQVAYHVSVPYRGDLTPDHTVVPPDGYGTTCGPPSGCTFDQPGTHHILVTFHEPGEHVLEIAEPAPIGFPGGGQHTTGAVPEDGTVELTFQAPAGADVVVELAPYGFDAVLEVDGPAGYYSSDSGFTSGSETVAIFGAPAGEYTILVSAYPGTGGGEFEVWLDFFE